MPTFSPTIPEAVFKLRLKVFCSLNPNLKVCGLSLDILNRTADKVEGTVRLYLL